MSWVVAERDGKRINAMEKTINNLKTLKNFHYKFHVVISKHKKLYSWKNTQISQ